MNHQQYKDVRPGSIESQIIEHSLELKKLRKRLSSISIKKIEEVMRVNAKIAETERFIEILTGKLAS